MAVYQYFASECIDKQTGRSFVLRLLGVDLAEARNVASQWGFVTGPETPSPPCPMNIVGGGTVRRGNEWVPCGEVAEVSRQEDLNRMLAVVHQDCHPVDRHFFLQNLSELAYKLRDQRSDALYQCEWACWQWMIESRLLLSELRKDFSGSQFVHVRVPKRLVILLEKSGERERAVDVARKCGSLDLSMQDLEYLGKKASKVNK
ncbi:MAG: hypothetical protein ACTS3F_11505 [Phycisphaerales bacterium]